MTGEMTIQVTKYGYGIDADLDDVSMADKLELLHAVATTMGLTQSEITLFCQLERVGVFANAQTVHSCEDDAQLERMLKGAGPNKANEPASLDDVLNALRDLSELLGGMV